MSATGLSIRAMIARLQATISSPTSASIVPSASAPALTGSWADWTGWETTPKLNS